MNFTYCSVYILCSNNIISMYEMYCYNIIVKWLICSSIMYCDVLLYTAVATVIVTSPETQNVTAGQSFMLICNATGYPVPSIEWRLNETSYMIRDSSITTITLTGGLRSNTSNITVTNAVTNDTGIYECVATNVVNTDTQDANVTVQS